MAKDKDEGFQPPTQGPIFSDVDTPGDADQRGQFVVDDSDSIEVPDGSVAEVQTWMGLDKVRAKAVLKAEGKDGRKSLMTAAQRVLDEDTGAGIASGEV
jgi:hypothetical protein